MSSHYIYLACGECQTSNSLYTGNLDPDDFINSQWEGSFIETICDNCVEGNN